MRLVCEHVYCAIRPGGRYFSHRSSCSPDIGGAYSNHACTASLPESVLPGQHTPNLRAAYAAITAASRLVMEPGYFDLRKLETRVNGPFAL
jgi:hypothetical protein